jgi:type I restriction-modification system DNA methylase subunit
MERHSSLRPLIKYEAHYMNSTGYWMSFSSAAMALRGEVFKLEGTTGVEEAERFDVWAMMAVRYGLRVVGLRVEFYKRSAKDTMHTRLVMPVLEGQNDMPAQDDLDDVMAKLDMHMATQLMKAAASLHAKIAVKCSEDGGAASQ